MKSPVLIASLLMIMGATEALPAATGQIRYDDAKAVELGRELVAQLRSLVPETSFTNTGTLAIKPRRQALIKVAYTCRAEVTETNWTSYYSAARGTNILPGFSVEHRAGQPGVYRDSTGKILSRTELDVSFAGSDFWLSDLGLEFFHWPDQRVSRWEMKRSFGCKVLESRNPHPTPDNYARVISWIHEETGGLIQAEAYDVRGKLLKEFRPTAVQKVNGRHELKEMEIENIRTESVTRLEFDL
jgi:hypothetical protein